MFLKEFNYGVEMHKMRTNYQNNLMHYGLVGEERVAYELSKINSMCICLYNVRLFIGDRKAQFDFIVILPSFILIIEVKNLLGNLIITEDQSFERELNIKGIIQKSGMSNPFIQMEYQEKVLKEFCNIFYLSFCLRKKFYVQYFHQIICYQKVGFQF